VLLSTDYVPQSIVAAIESAWGCRVFNHYGTTEMGLGGGVFCEGDYGYHLREADLFFEIIDPHSGRAVPDGEPGEVVFTTLTRVGMPLLRYRTGDFSRFLPEPCPCGSLLKSMAKIAGRIDQVFTLNSHSYHLSDLDEALFPTGGLINYSLTVNQDNAKDSLHIILYHLPCDNRNFLKTVKENFTRLGIATDDSHITFEMIEGYPQELSSMRKRKIEQELN
jgi:phenylacetate-CoA ligase